MDRLVRESAGNGPNGFGPRIPGLPLTLVFEGILRWYHGLILTVPRLTKNFRSPIFEIQSLLGF